VYARFSVICVGPGMRHRMEELADRLAGRFEALPGFRAVTFLMDEAAGDYGSFSLWDTRESAEAASAAVSPRVAEIFKGMLTPWIFEVYEPGRRRDPGNADPPSATGGR
jgi:heme-degrading monooxygenase HmoA